MGLPWCKANGHEVEGNVIRSNSFVSDRVAVQLRSASDTRLIWNKYQDVGLELDADSEPEYGRLSLRQSNDTLQDNDLTTDLPGSNHPVGARIDLRGRNRIVIDEWGGGALVRVTPGDPPPDRAERGSNPSRRYAPLHPALELFQPGAPGSSPALLLSSSSSSLVPLARRTETSQDHGAGLEPGVPG